MPFADPALSHYEPEHASEQRKYCINLYPEETKTDRARPYKLIGTPGTSELDTDNLTSVRGLAQQDGHAGGDVLISDATTVRRYNVAGDSFTAMTGTLTGTDRTQWAFSEVQGAVLSDGDIYISNGSSVTVASDPDFASLLSDHGQLGFTSIDSIGQRLLFSYGSRFGFTETLDFDATTAINFYTAENQPDGIVGLGVLGDIVYVFGTDTVELWTQTGVNTNPFRYQPGSTLQRGCAGRDTIKRLANTLCWVSENDAVCRLVGGGYEKISPAWVDRLIRRADKSQLVASAYETEGHAFYILSGAEFTLCFDALWAVKFGNEEAWTLRRTLGRDDWEWAYIATAGGKQFCASRYNARFASLSRDHLSDYDGDEIVREGSWSVSVPGGREAIPAIRFDGAKGAGTATGQGFTPAISLRLSRDSITYGNWRQKSLGALGEYRARAIWRRNGRSRDPQLIGHYRISDPVRCDVRGWAIGEDN